MTQNDEIIPQETTTTTEATKVQNTAAQSLDSMMTASMTAKDISADTLANQETQEESEDSDDDSSISEISSDSSSDITDYRSTHHHNFRNGTKKYSNKQAYCWKQGFLNKPKEVLHDDHVKKHPLLQRMRSSKIQLQLRKKSKTLNHDKSAEWQRLWETVEFGEECIQAINQRQEWDSERVAVYCPFQKRKIVLDTDIAAFIRLLWGCGVTTSRSWANSSNRYINFVADASEPWMAIELFASDFSRFLEIICNDLDESNSEELRRALRLDVNRKNWKYSCEPFLDPLLKISGRRSENDTTEQTTTGLFVTIEFPKSDYAFILEQCAIELTRLHYTTK